MSMRRTRAPPTSPTMTYRVQCSSVTVWRYTLRMTRALKSCPRARYIAGGSLALFCNPTARVGVSHQILITNCAGSNDNHWPVVRFARQRCTADRLSRSACFATSGRRRQLRRQISKESRCCRKQCARFYSVSDSVMCMSRTFVAMAKHAERIMHLVQPPALATDYLFAVQKRDHGKFNVATLFDASEELPPL